MKRLFNQNWKFLKTPAGTTFDEAHKCLGDFNNVEIPHDWMIEDAQNLYADATGWYLNHFEAMDGRRLFFVFDGIYMDSIVYINGHEAGEWKSGYSQFVLDVTDYVVPGTNEILVAARCKYPSARWYTGAGIYRNVWLCDYSDIFIPENGIYVHSSKIGESYLLEISTDISGLKESDENENVYVRHRLFDNDGNEVPIMPQINKDEEVHTYKRFIVDNPKEWSPSSPVLYELLVELYAGVDVDTSNQHTYPIQTESVRIGFRNIRFDNNRGLFINDEHIKLNGVCLHHDLGALGVAFNKGAMKRRLVQLQKMGVNALRLTHNVYDPAVLDMADEMGFLVLSESMDMWERSKTDYDFARFFPDWYKKEVESWVRRDRNHTSVFMWSIGNEIYDTHVDSRGLELTIILRDEVRKYDPLRNGLVTSASNYMEWENAQKCAPELDVVGYNYLERLYKKQHKANPEWIIFGSETSSIVQSRGIYHFPLDEHLIKESDLQCSSLGNSITEWSAKSMEACVCEDRDMEFSLGQFLWTGYDYIGEPTPYETKNSYFGLIDTAGFFKDAYYVWKSAWVSCKDNPFVHIFPYWDFNEGQRIDVRVVSNLPFVELFLNGKSLGKQELTHAPGAGDHIIADYSVIYEEGELRAAAYDEEGKIIAETARCSFKDTHALNVTTEDVGDLIFAEISAVDEDGNPVENARDYVKVTVENGTLVGFDNGDSTDYDSYKADTKRLFAGKALVIVKKESTLDAEGSCITNSVPKVVPSLLPGSDIRTIKLKVCEKTSTDNGIYTLTPGNKKITVSAEVFPKGADDSDLCFRILSRNRGETTIAKVRQDGCNAIVEALSDGEFVLRCEASNGANEVKVISELDFKSVHSDEQ
ncbi:glycoside hydrolase family 2 TIM barrel-domain containing protein [Butyrivibrio sp. INlla16]|uniref:glycoside hydrolase family 2 TIM barrel-domain containing protein n=1 Tax=Butyrivibrio sp. INlla16 TaxID=1520807 RepID=UPI000883BBC3|nr:glycoside hydrolase family 2 TIM barrel-domain containing protein [Butyrivibrio sp. INlla16]SDB26839.1 beta-galactosidase [Butyrivibrio sp. INlla16]